jgi:hypothetical protein
MQADRQTDMKREIDAFLWCFAKDSEKNKRCLACVHNKNEASRMLHILNYVFYDSVEITNKIQPCNRIYYSTVH